MEYGLLSLKKRKVVFMNWQTYYSNLDPLSFLTQVVCSLSLSLSLSLTYTHTHTEVGTVLGVPIGHIFANLILTILMQLSESRKKNKCYNTLEFLLSQYVKPGTKLVEITWGKISISKGLCKSFVKKDTEMLFGINSRQRILQGRGEDIFIIISFNQKDGRHLLCAY